MRPPASVASRLAAGAVAAALAAAIVAGSVAAAREPAAGVTRCDGARIAVHGGGAADVAAICAGGRDAFRFFDARKLETSIDVDVEVTGVLPDRADAAALGCYHPARKRVYLLPWAEFARRGKWFGVATDDPALYRSLATHEIAHAIVTCGLGTAQLSTAAMEYIGHVAMLSAMPADLRRRVLEQQPGSGFGAAAEIDTFVYLLDPERFAVKSYRHYQRPENGDRFLRDLLSGRILLE